MRKLIAFCCIALLCWQCSSDSENREVQYQSFAHYSKLFQPKWQVFTMNNSSDTLLKAKGGLEIYLPKNAFQTNDSATPIELRVKEYTNPLAYLAEGATTTSEGQLLISGGTAYLAAFQGDELLELQKGKTLQLHFPKTKDNTPMSTYYGVFENGKMNWKLDSATVVLFNEQKEIIIPRSRNDPDYYKGDVVQACRLRINGNEKANEERIATLADKLFAIKLESVDSLSNYTTVLVERGQAGKVLNYQTENEKATALNEKVVALLKEVHEPINSVMISIPLPVKVSEYPVGIDERNSLPMTDSIPAPNWVSKGEERLTRLLTSGRLGWINKDYLYTYPDRGRRSLTIAAPNMRTNAFIVLKKRRAIIPTIKENANQLQFAKILPHGDEAYLVAFSTIDNREKIAIKPFVIGESDDFTLDFKEMTKAEITAAIQTAW